MPEKRRVEGVLAEALEELGKGHKNIEEISAEYAVLGADLAPLLRLALELHYPKDVEPSPQFKRLARARLMQRICAEPVTRWSLLRYLNWESPIKIRRMSMPALIVAIILAITVMASGGTAVAAQGSLPGDPLYTVKTSLEQLQLGLAPSAEAKAQVYEELAAKRLSELAKSIQLGRSEAAGDLAEQYRRNVDKAVGLLVEDEAEGKDVTVPLARLQENLARQQSALARVMESAPAEARSSLERARETSRWGIEIASRAVEGKKPSGKRVGTPAAEVTPTTPATPAPLTPTPPPTATPSISNTIGITLTQTISDVVSLSADPNVPGQSYEGLLAKLLSVQASLERGQTKVSLNQLDAFLHELNALQRSGHISQANYDRLYAAYTTLISSLGGEPQPALPAGQPTPAATPSPEAKPRPTRQPGVTPPRRGEPEEGQERRATPARTSVKSEGPSATPTPTATPVKPETPSRTPRAHPQGRVTPGRPVENPLSPTPAAEPPVVTPPPARERGPREGTGQPPEQRSAQSHSRGRP
ncbi:MAG: DUF5667 domain-containing protein [Chloroflexi bacterium]|nr:DUF5667 domain-containing protein [Chloroflexota bacterium]MCL5074075.1 DUF5667 domain-containing protein [Chloroflexota bacterium]